VGTEADRAASVCGPAPATEVASLANLFAVPHAILHGSRKAIDWQVARQFSGVSIRDGSKAVP
jgi:hypothetical protein